MKVRKLEFELSDNAVIEGSPAWADLIMNLKVSRLRVVGRDIYHGEVKQGYVDSTKIVADNNTDLERFCRLYNPPRN